MLIGAEMPIRGALAQPATMVRLAIEAEAMGFGYVCLGDHLVMPNHIGPTYPYSRSGEMPIAARSGRHELLTTIAYLAGKTKKLRFLTAIMVVPHRPAVLTAKMLATIDNLSEGRLTVACGSGWLKEEFEAIGAPPFEKRGAATDEYMAAFRELWDKEDPRMDGEFVRFSDINFEPKPVQLPRLPLWVGGEGAAALRRTAKLGDGWYPLNANPKSPLDTLTRYSAAVEKLHLLVGEQGRKPGDISLGYFAVQHGMASDGSGFVDGERKLFIGADFEIAEDLRAFQKIGVDSVDFRFGGATVEEAIDKMRRFRSDIVEKI